MALVEQASDHHDGPELTHIALELDLNAHELLVELMQRTGWDASELVGWALGAQWRELEGIVLPPPQAWSEADLAAIQEGIAQLDRGEFYTQEEVEAHIDALLRE